MDGGRLLRAALAVPLGFPRATQLAARIGQWIAFAMGFAGLFGNPMLIVIAIFIYFAAASESQATAVRSFSAGIPLRRAMMTEFATLPTDAPVATAVETFLRTSQRAIPVVDTGGRIAGIVEIGDVVRAVQEPSSAPQISDVMTKDIPTIGQDAELGDAFRILQEKSAPAVAVVDRTSRLVGLVTLETLGEMLLLHEASPTVFDGFHVQPWGSAPRG
jgi:stage IV sporulation protein FB